MNYLVAYKCKAIRITGIYGKEVMNIDSLTITNNKIDLEYFHSVIEEHLINVMKLSNPDIKILSISPLDCN